VSCRLSWPDQIAPDGGPGVEAGLGGDERVRTSIVRRSGNIAPLLSAKVLRLGAKQAAETRWPLGTGGENGSGFDFGGNELPDAAVARCGFQLEWIWSDVRVSCDARAVENWLVPGPASGAFRTESRHRIQPGQRAIARPVRASSTGALPGPPCVATSRRSVKRTRGGAGTARQTLT